MPGGPLATEEVPATTHHFVEVHPYVRLEGCRLRLGTRTACLGVASKMRRRRLLWKDAQQHPRAGSVTRELRAYYRGACDDKRSHSPLFLSRHTAASNPDGPDKISPLRSRRCWLFRSAAHPVLSLRSEPVALTPSPSASRTLLTGLNCFRGTVTPLPPASFSAVPRRSFRRRRVYASRIPLRHPSRLRIGEDHHHVSYIF